MAIIIILIAISLSIALLFLAIFYWNMRSGQYDDTYTPSVRILFDNKPKTEKENDAMVKWRLITKQQYKKNSPSSPTEVQLIHFTIRITINYVRDCKRRASVTAHTYQQFTIKAKESWLETKTIITSEDCKR